MAATMILTGDVNLMHVADAAEPFARVKEELGAADLVFSNLECCLYRPPRGHAVEHEGFFADPVVGGRALTEAGIGAVGLANNVNYGESAITASIAELDRLGIAHTGAGGNCKAAQAPAIAACGGARIGFLQRSSVYWPTNHEAGDNSSGIAVIRAHTAYQVPMHRTRPGIPPLNRPGIPPEIVTWADKAYLRSFCEDIAGLRQRADIVVASCHWGLFEEVLQYMTEIAHAAIEAGADIVVGHGPHYALPVERYRGRPIFYGLGSFSFHTGHGGRRHGDWLGMMATVLLDGDGVADASFRFVRHDDSNHTFLCALADEAGAFDALSRKSAAFGTQLAARGDAVAITLGRQA